MEVVSVGNVWFMFDLPEGIVAKINFSQDTYSSCDLVYKKLVQQEAILLPFTNFKSLDSLLQKQ